MIDILCLVRYQDLYRRMKESAQETAHSELQFHIREDTGLPKIAQAFNSMGDESKSDILVFLHDDVNFLSPGWDAKLIEALSQFDVAGVVGMESYSGGRIFNDGFNKAVGKYACIDDGIHCVKIFKPTPVPTPVKVIDGMFMAVNKKYFNNHKFSLDFDELFFYDLDYCLGARCCVVDILISHDKPQQYYGKYPEGMKSIGQYWDKFHSKHNLSPLFPGDQMCSMVKVEDFIKTSHENIYAEFERQK